MKDFVAVSRIYNNQLRQRRLELGMSQVALAEAIGIPQASYCAYEGLRQSPWKRATRELKDTARKICEFHGLEAAELFPDAIEDVVQRSLETRFDAEEMTQRWVESHEAKLLPSPQDFVEEKEQLEVVDKLLSTLTPREERVLRMKFGLSEEKREMTWAEIGADFEVSSARVQQIAAKAFRKCQHPSRFKVVEEYGLTIEEIQRWRAKLLEKRQKGEEVTKELEWVFL